MKNALIALGLSIGLAAAGYAACDGPFCYDDTGASIEGAGLSLTSRTIAQLNAQAPARVGQLVMCSDCTRSAVCVSSGTSAGAYVILTATGPFAGATYSGIQHCQ